jgi:aminodeoxychorismate lyase
MDVFLNGRFLPETQAVVPISDRGFLYGDGLFETLRISHGRPFCWDQHVERLERGAAFLKLQSPWPSLKLREFAQKLIQRNAMPDSVLRLTLTRGSGSRGFSPKEANSPTLAMTLHPLPTPSSPLRLVTASLRVPANDPLASFKTANKLVHILARAEAEERGADEALLLNTNGHVAEAAASNVFWLENGAVCTPPVADGALAGVTRAVVLELCRTRNVPTKEAHITPEELHRADGVFLTNSVAGIVFAAELDGRPLIQSPFVVELQAAYEELLRAESGR